MPNWCFNRVTIQHDDPKKIKEIKEIFSSKNVFEQLLPQPDYSVTAVPRTNPEIKAAFEEDPVKKAAILKNEPTIRKDSWWDWRIQNWGTKWDIDGSQDADVHINEEDHDRVEYTFDTAWAPAEGIYHRLIELGYIVSWFYDEPGMCFAGYLPD